MEDINIVLHNSITIWLERVSMSLSVPACEAKKPTPTNDRKFPDIREHTIAPYQTDSTTIELSCSENKVEIH